MVLKNLAAVLAAEEGTAAQALGLYGEAAMLDAGDIVLWNRMGTLVRIICSVHTCKCAAGNLPCSAAGLPHITMWVRHCRHN